ncbi:MAG: DMT family transporter [Eubacteriales bacterium]
MKNDLKGHLFAISTVIIWSSTFIVSKVLLEQLTPLQILFGRFMMAVLFLSIIYPKFEKPYNIREELLFFFIGCSLALYFYCENTALIYTYSSNVSLIDATIPIMTGIIASVYYGNKFLTKSNILGFIFAYSGVALIIISGNDIAGINPMGDFIALLGAFLFSIYTIILQKLKFQYHSIALTRKIFLYGGIVLSILLILSKEQLSFDSINNQVIMSMIFLGIIASSLAFLMWNIAIERLGSVKANQYIYLVPVFTTIISMIVIHEKITFVKILGAFLIITGLYISEKFSSKRNSILTELPSDKTAT